MAREPPEPRAVRAVRAAVEIAAAAGVRCDDPVVLRDLSNLLVQLRPAPVVARVAGGSPRAWAAVERLEGPVGWDVGCLHASARAFGGDPAAVAAAQASYGPGLGRAAARVAFYGGRPPADPPGGPV